MRHTRIPAATDRVAASIVDAALAVHRALGPGLLESAYEQELAIELRDRGHGLTVQPTLNATYRGQSLESVFRLDLIVDDCVIVELKAVEQLLPVHTAQLLTYLRLSGLRLGLLLNFNSVQLRHGMKRIAL
jgi:GxxExxY protein